MSEDMLNNLDHQRLIDAMPTIISQSHVPEVFIRTSARGNVDDADIKFLSSYHALKSNGVAGYCKVGGKGASRKLNFMAGALIRNYVDARVLSLESSLLGAGEEPTVLFVPDFCVETNDGRPFVGWKVQQVYDLLVTRMSKSKPTVLYVQSFGLLETNFGKSVADFVETNYIRG